MYEKYQFQKILHLADIHIRLYKRHDEYKQVFEKLYQQFRDYRTLHPNQNVLIVLAGDIVHAKTEMSPEMVEMVSDLLRSVSDIAPTILLPGNHDMNMANPNRLDALSPIVENLNLEHLHYLKDSGIYEFGNVGVAVYSIMGDPVNWPKATDIRKEYRVGLYHGPLNGATTDVGYTITGKNIDLSTFDGLDIVLLGDIHRYQVMQFWTRSQNKPAIVYPGSLIQQNHGESLDTHGFVEWDLMTREHIHYSVPNDYGYVTLEVNNATLTNLPKLPPNVRLRLFTDDADPSDVKKLLTLLKYTHKINILETTINKKLLPIDSLNNSTKSLDVQDVDWQNKLLREYITQNFAGTSDEVVDDAIEINKKLNAKIQEDELPRNINWRPLNLKFDNLFSYGEGNEINFETMQGLYGIFSPNATGKTSAFDAMCFALYDKTPRAFKGSHIMNTRANMCGCELIFEIGQNKYRIVRTGVRKKTGEVKIDVEFARYDNGSWIDLHGTDRRDTNAIIRSYVGDYNDFVLTNLSVQGQNALYIDKGQAERKDLLNQFMGLTIFDKLSDRATEESKEIAATLKRFNKEDFTTALSEIQASIDTLTDERDSAADELTSAKEHLKDINDRLLQKTSELIPIDLAIQNIVDLERGKQQIEIDIQKTHDKVNKLRERYASLGDDIKQKGQTDTTATFNGQPVADAVTELEKCESFVHKLHTEIEVLNVKLQGWIKKIEALKNHKYDPNCKYCVSNPFVVDAKEAQRLYDDSLPTMVKWNAKYNEFSDRIVELLPAREQQKAHRRYLDDIQVQKTELLKTELAIQVSENDIGKLEKQLTSQLGMIQKWLENQKAIEQNEKTAEEITHIQREKKLAEDEVESYEREYHEVFGNLQIAVSKKNDLMEKIKMASDLEDTYEAYECYIDAVSRDGIPYNLLSAVVPTIQTVTNELLNQIVDFSVSLEVDGKNINGMLYYDNDRKWPLELSSGMEKFVAGLAIRVALMTISSLPRSNFLVIDEGFGVLDSENLASIFAVFNVLKTKFDFLVLISHLEVVRDVSDNLIEIKVTDGYSKIVVA